MTYIGALAVLVVFAVFAFNNRFLGQEFYAPRVGRLAAHWGGVAIQLAFIAGVTLLFLQWLQGGYTRADLWAIGVLWAVLAEAWEIVVMRRNRHWSWARALGEYNPLSGHGWALVALAYLLAPVLVHNWLLAG